MTGPADGRPDGGLVLIASYPKSGNTWARAFLASAMAEGCAIDINANLAGTVMGADRANFDSALGLDSAAMSPLAVAAARHRVWGAVARGRPGPLWLKVHDAWAPFQPGCPLPYAADDIRAVIHVVRDPRDVAISFAAHFEIPLDAAIGWMADEQAMLDADPAHPARQLPQLLSSWSGHVASWMGAEALRVLTVRYEDMHAAPIETFGRIAHWAGLDASPGCIARAVAESGFSRLRSQEADKGFVEGESRDAFFFRQGEAGGWRNSLSDHQAMAIVARHGTVMRRLGYRA